MHIDEDALTNHEVTICLRGGVKLGPFQAAWSKDTRSDVRELAKEYDRFLQGGPQTRYKFHLHDPKSNSVHTIFLRFENVTAICDHVQLL